MINKFKEILKDIKEPYIFSYIKDNNPTNEYYQLTSVNGQYDILMKLLADIIDKIYINSGTVPEIIVLDILLALKNKEPINEN